MRRRMVLFWVGGLLLGAVLATAGFATGVRWQRDRVPSLRATNGTGFGIELTADQRVASFYAGVVCLDRPGPAEILAVNATAKVPGARVTGFTVVPYRQLGGGVVGPMSRAEGYVAGSTVSATCNHEQQVQLVVETRRPSGASVTFKNLVITYRVGGRTRTVHSDVDLGMCTRGTSCPAG